MSASFRNDVHLDEIPRVGEGVALVGDRFQVGTAVQFTGSDDVSALVEFLGGLRVVDGNPYRTMLDGSLVPFEFQVGAAYFKPMAGDWSLLTEANLMQRTAILVSDEAGMQAAIDDADNDIAELLSERVFLRTDLANAQAELEKAKAEVAGLEALIAEATAPKPATKAASAAKAANAKPTATGPITKI